MASNQTPQSSTPKQTQQLPRGSRAECTLPRGRNTEWWREQV